MHTRKELVCTGVYFIDCFGCCVFLVTFRLYILCTVYTIFISFTRLTLYSQRHFFSRSLAVVVVISNSDFWRVNVLRNRLPACKWFLFVALKSKVYTGFHEYTRTHQTELQNVESRLNRMYLIAGRVFICVFLCGVHK